MAAINNLRDSPIVLPQFQFLLNQAKATALPQNQFHALFYLKRFYLDRTQISFSVFNDSNLLIYAKNNPLLHLF